MIYDIKHDNDWQITCSKFEMMSKICKLFKKFSDFDWTDVVMAGPLLNAMILKKYGLEYAASIDLYISNKNNFCKTFEYFKRKLKTIYSMSPYRNMVIILSPHFNRPIKLFGLFDQSCCPSFGAYFDGDNCVADDEYLEKCRGGQFSLPMTNPHYVPTEKEGQLYVLAKIKYHYNRSYIIEDNDLVKASCHVFESI